MKEEMFMLRYDIHPIKRQQIFAVMWMMADIALVISFAISLPLMSAIWFTVIACLFGGSSCAVLLLFTKKYRLKDDYPYLLAVKFWHEERITQKVMMELSKCGVLFQYKDGNWTPINHD